MKLKNIHNYTHQELIDIITQAKAYMQFKGLEEVDITLANYQEELEGEQHYYEVYKSLLTIEEDTTVEEALEMQIDTEKVVKEYKTKRGLIQAFLNDKDVNGEYYRIHTQL